MNYRVHSWWKNAIEDFLDFLELILFRLFYLVIGIDNFQHRCRIFLHEWRDYFSGLIYQKIKFYQIQNNTFSLHWKKLVDMYIVIRTHYYRYYFHCIHSQTIVRCSIWYVSSIFTHYIISEFLKPLQQKSNIKLQNMCELEWYIKNVQRKQHSSPKTDHSGTPLLSGDKDGRMFSASIITCLQPHWYEANHLSSYLANPRIFSFRNK